MPACAGGVGAAKPIYHDNDSAVFPQRDREEVVVFKLWSLVWLFLFQQQQREKSQERNGHGASHGNVGRVVSDNNKTKAAAMGTAGCYNVYISLLTQRKAPRPGTPRLYAPFKHQLEKRGHLRLVSRLRDELVVLVERGPVRIAKILHLLDGFEFDSSQDDEPIVVVPNRVIKGWSEALQLMKVKQHTASSLLKTQPRHTYE